MTKKPQAIDKKSFILYTDSLPLIEKLTIPQRGHLLTAVFEYHKGNHYEVDQLTDMALEHMLSHLKRDEEKWMETRAKRSESGRKGGLAKQANARSAKQNKQSLANLAVSVSDSVSENKRNGGKAEDKATDKTTVATADRSNAVYSAEFERFWAEYPNRKSKKGAAKAFTKAIKCVDLDTMIAAVKVQRASKDWTKDGGQYVPMAQTWLNNDRWEDSVSPNETTFHAVKQDYFGNWINSAGQTREQFEESK